MRIAVLSALALGTVIIVAGCGGGGYGGGKKHQKTTYTSGSTNTRQQALTVDESEYKLSPSTLDVKKPGTVEIKIVNKGTIDHAFEVEGNGVEQKISTLSPGDTTTITVSLAKAGSYEIYCPVDGHRNKGMKGTITVGGSGAGAGTTGTTTKTQGGYGYG